MVTNMISRFVPLCNSFIKILTSSGNGIRRWALEGCLSHEVEALMNGTGTLLTEAPEVCLVPCTM